MAGPLLSVTDYRNKDLSRQVRGCLLTLTYPDLSFLNRPSQKVGQFQLGQLLLWAQLVLTWPKQIVTPEGLGPPPEPPPPLPSCLMKSFPAKTPTPQAVTHTGRGRLSVAWLSTVQDGSSSGAAETRNTGEVLMGWLGLVLHRKRSTPIIDRTLKINSQRKRPRHTLTQG